MYYNNRTVYECFNNTFIDKFGGPDLNLPPITIYDRSRPLKEPAIPQICFHLTFMFPLKILFLLWPPLWIRHISLLLMIIILSMLWINKILNLAGWKGYTDLGNMIKKILQKDKALLIHLFWKKQEISLLSWIFQD